MALQARMAPTAWSAFIEDRTGGVFPAVLLANSPSLRAEGPQLTEKPGLHPIK